MKLSAVVAAGNEERMIGPCLDWLSFCDEIVVVVDASSTDRTERIARRHTDRVFQRRLESFAKQKNFGIRKARGEWILIVDADERIPPALAAEIKTVLADPGKAVGFDIERYEFLFGKHLEHGAWDERLLRLIKKRQARYVGDIHEEFHPRGTVGRLRQPMWHFSNRSIGNLLSKLGQRVELHAAQMEADGHPKVTARNLLAVPVKEAWRRLIRHRGYKDGAPGVIQTLYTAFLYFFGYVRLWERQSRPSLEKTYEQLERQVTRNR